MGGQTVASMLLRGGYGYVAAIMGGIITMVTI